MGSVKQEFYSHLTQIGFDFQSPREVILQKLHGRMGNQRFAEFKTKHSHSASSQQEFYKQFKDIIEGNLMRSLDSHATLDASFSLYERCNHRLLPGARVIELGCWTGGLASFRIDDGSFISTSSAVADPSIASINPGPGVPKSKSLFAG